MSAHDEQLASARERLRTLRPAQWTPQLIDELALQASGLETLGRDVRVEALAASDDGRRRVRALEREQAGAGVASATVLAILAAFAAAVPWALTFSRNAPVGDVTVAQALSCVLVAALLVVPGIVAVRTAISAVAALLGGAAAVATAAVAVVVAGETTGWPVVVAGIAATIALAAAVPIVVSALVRRRAADARQLRRIDIRARARAELDAERLRQRALLDARVEQAGGDASAILALRRILLEEVEAVRPPPPTPMPGSRLLVPEEIDARHDAPPGGWIVDSLVRLPRDETDVALEQHAARSARSR